MLRIGITGGIGSGKSFVCRKLCSMGLYIFDCDREAKKIMESSSQVIAGLKNLIGENVYTADGKIDKQVMSAYLFSGAEQAAAVSSIVHPAVGRGFSDFVAAHATAPACVMESAILLESGLVPLVDKVVCVRAPLEVRIQRVRQRDGLDEISIRKRIARQMNEEDRNAYPFDYLIENDGLSDLTKQLEMMLAEFKLF